MLFITTISGVLLFALLYGVGLTLHYKLKTDCTACVVFYGLLSVAIAIAFMYCVIYIGVVLAAVTASTQGMGIAI